ncbi:MAG: hypothetical protein IT430_00475 [Phycisphaerales bacterium]|nr:hypothetical protein [Phycisphaerales bacterium]
MANKAERIDVEQARQDVQSGQALLVCGYEEPEKFENNHLQGAISLQDFESQRDSVPKEQEIIFYCA